MNLAARRSARQWENIVMRLGCVLVSAALVVSLVLEPPKAKAEALTLAVSGGVVLLASYLAACGMTPYFNGSWNAESVVREVERLGKEFVDEVVVIFMPPVLPGGSKPPTGGDKPSFNDWLGMIAFTVSNGVVRFGKDAAAMLNQFASWVASKYGTKPGMNVVYGVTGDYVTLADGEKFYLCTGINGGKFSNFGSPITQSSFPFVFSTGYSLEIRYFDIPESGDYICYLNPQGEIISRGKAHFDTPEWWPIYVGIVDSRVCFMMPDLLSYSLWASFLLSQFDVGTVVSADESLSLDVSDTMQEILDRLTALEEGQSIALDVGATDSMSIQEILQGILDAILTGDLTATAEVVDTAEVPVDPEDPDPPVVPELPTGLDRLGAALTSRFPFSIPWDVYKGVKLLAAPAKAPYFEVDFMAPIAYRVGGWKGSTKIVLDMSEYEIIGQVCRWTSTIGFCLVLASGTKRLIWTA